MKLFAPKYYKKFKCIADKCEHSCCIGWEIDVDGDTLEKYRSLQNGYGKTVIDSISTEDTPHFKLCEGDRCPHLDENGLCRIILSVGEDYLCHICREHPRFYNFTDVCEVGIGMSCPEAARIVLSSPDYAEMELIGEVDAQTCDILFDARAERSKIYEILQNVALDYHSKLAEICQIYAINSLLDGVWLEKLENLEYLDDAHRDLFLNYSSARRPSENHEYLERFLAYFIYRHCTEAEDEYDFRRRLGFCLFCEGLFASLICTDNAKTLNAAAALASIISEEIEYSDENTWSLIDINQEDI